MGGNIHTARFSLPRPPSGGYLVDIVLKVFQ